MKCGDVHTTHPFKDLHNTDIIRILKKERNDFAKSRQQWIQAAFDIVYRGNDDLFDKLVEEELCDNCATSYAKGTLIKTEV